MKPHEKKHLVVLVGSARPKNYTFKAVRILEQQLKKEDSITYEIIDPAQLSLPLPGTAYKDSSHEALQKSVKQATGVIIASPEYHGGISSVMKLLIDHLGFPSALAGKPIALLGVAAGMIGAIKSLEQIRSICSHVGAIVLPRPISIANVQQVFDEEGNCLDQKIQKQIYTVATTLINYIDQHICPKIALEHLIRREKKGI
ncbi:MAG: NADH-dependent flavin reductase subunit 2 [Chlamydiales bacterium]|nr:NADH-dependent flavin reductase subunit 2 [Chlamydiales bacterium]MCH9619951.1 NADH-dependent flavin reductase subunit 2 [Chlamydiales bacterium]MCH9622622.1 NADH-dependent flavin reductase subunit 2 [Chlamydiales bacterium]